MTTDPSPASTPPRRARRPRRVLRGLGSVLCVLALTMLGLGAGLWLGSPASAATPPLEVDMYDGLGFVSSTATPLLTVGGLAPGGSVAGEMQVKDVSGNTAASGSVDAISLRIINTTATDGGPAGKPPVVGSGSALQAALTFEVQVFAVPSGTLLRQSTESVASLGAAAGVPLAAGLLDGQIVKVRVTAALPDGLPGVDNPFQYGKFAFDLELALTSAATPTGGGGGAGGGDNAVVLTTPSSIEVLDTASTAPDDENVAVRPGGDNVIVLGENQEALPNTGVPVASMLIIGGGVLAIGIVVLLLTRRKPQPERSRRE